MKTKTIRNAFILCCSMLGTGSMVYHSQWWLILPWMVLTYVVLDKKED